MDIPETSPINLSLLLYLFKYSNKTNSNSIKKLYPGNKQYAKGKIIGKNNNTIEHKNEQMIENKNILLHILFISP